jgi:arginyl-tRNA synthetase
MCLPICGNPSKHPSQSGAIRHTATSEQPDTLATMMQDLKTQLKTALEALVPPEIEVVIQDTPPGKPGDYGSPVAFVLAKALKQNPAQIAKDLAKKVQLPSGVARAEAVGPYLNFFVDSAVFIKNVVSGVDAPAPQNQKVIIEHTSVNPNKEWHVGHIRGALIGDALGRIYRAAGYNVEIQNYIDDTGRQAAESQFAVQHYNAVWDGKQKYDHWLGELYVRLHAEFDFKKKTPEAQALEPAIAEVIHKLERGELREEIAKVLRSQLETAYSLGIEYDLLVWESDVVKAGFVEKALEIFGAHLVSPTEGKYVGAKGVDLSPFVPGLEEPFKVLVRGNGTFVYETKDIAYHYWKFGLFEGLEYSKFELQKVSGKQLWTSSPAGQHEPDGHQFAHAQKVINVIDARQSLAQIVVKAGLGLVADGVYVKQHHHLANETVLLEGQTMSGRKGITVSADEVIAQAQARGLATMHEISPNHPNPEKVAPQIGLGALKFAFLKATPERQIDFRWDTALALQGDTSVKIQYAHARARKIARDYVAEGYSGIPDFAALSELELGLLKTVAKFSEVLSLCTREQSPHPMCVYALELASVLNAYYNHKDSNGKYDTRVLKSPEGLREARLAVVTRVADAIRLSLAVLGIEAPDEM